MKIVVNVPAKINLALDILGKRQDGYHLVEMVMQSIDLYDIITIELNNSKSIVLDSNIRIVDNIEKNTVYIAANQFFNSLKILNPGVKISLEKSIPMQAGLAGGSADAAGVILGLNELFRTYLNVDKMIEIGSKIGADVPFCIFGGTMFSSGIGTILKRINNLPDCYIILSKPPIGVSTKDAYERSDNSNYVKPIKIENVVKAINSNDIRDISNNIFNRFEHVMNIKEVELIKNKMKNMGALNACMSGSGPTVFGIFKNKERAYNCFYELKKFYKETFVCRPNNGPTWKVYK